MSDDLAKLVKPLVWEDMSCLPSFEAYRAITLIGRYKAQRIGGQDYAILVDPDGQIARHKTIEAAKAAAQADYTARSISDLDPEALARWREEAVQAEREAIADLLEIIFAASDGIELRLGGTSETITLTEIVATIRDRKGGAA